MAITKDHVIRHAIEHYGITEADIFGVETSPSRVKLGFKSWKDINMSYLSRDYSGKRCCSMMQQQTHDALSKLAAEGYRPEDF